MIPEKTRYYLLQGLSATPGVIAFMLLAVPNPPWDRRPDPERFTLREILAHLADWEREWLNRLTAIRDRDRPTVQAYDEGVWAVEHGYAHADPEEQLVSFRQRRGELIRFLEALAPEQWDRTGIHPEFGPMSVRDWAALILGHDGYHARQVAEWLSLPAGTD